MTTRFIVRFPDLAAYHAAQALEVNHVRVPVASPKRQFISVEVPAADLAGRAAERYALEQLELFEQHYGADVRPDMQFELEARDIFDPTLFGPDLPGEPSLDDVLARIRADQAWSSTRGDDVAIAIVDTGINGMRPEFPAWKRVGAWQTLGDTPWTDWQGHGTMCATIAAATRADGGAFDGVAPNAGLIACKTRFFESELTDIYDYLTSLATNRGLRIVASNSFGLKTGVPPQTQSDLFTRALDDAIAAGITVVFSAGNYHELVGGQPDACAPTSIWSYKSRADVLVVATCTIEGQLWFYSSRGPGQDYGQPNTNRKPDVTAPTPQNGRIVFGDDIRTLPFGWGTSGAAPQVAGLAALIRSKIPTISPAELQNAIRETASSLAYGPDCVGTGLIDCTAAVDSL